MKTYTSCLLCILILLFTPVIAYAQAQTDLQGEIDQMKKTDKQMKYSISKCSKEIKALKKDMDDGFKKTESAVNQGKADMDSLQVQSKRTTDALSQKQDTLNARLNTVRLVLWTSIIVWIALMMVVYYSLNGKMARMKESMEAKMINDKEALELDVKKLEKEMQDKLTALEQKLSELKR